MMATQVCQVGQKQVEKYRVVETVKLTVEDLMAVVTKVLT